MKSVSSGKTKASHPHRRGIGKNKKKKKKKKYIKFRKSLEKQRKTASEQSEDILEPITQSPTNNPTSHEKKL